MSTRKLPEWGTSEAEELKAEYPTASQEQIELWSQKYRFSCKATFEDAMYRRLGVKRSGSVATMPDKKRQPIEPNVPLRLRLNGEHETVAVINDTHNPYQDEKALSLVEELLGEIQPDYLVYAGDMSDFYQISPFDKDPSRVSDMQADINNTKAMFRRHKQRLPNTKRKLLDGNHEERWQRFLWTKARELSSLDCLTIPELYDLGEYEIEHIPYERGLMINDIFLILHGTIASIHSGYTAKRMFEKHGGCGMCGHCHRGGSFYKRDRFGIWGWWENFCLCSLDPDWIMHPNWGQGFSLIHFVGSKRFWVEQIPIVNYGCVYGGKRYGI